MAYGSWETLPHSPEVQGIEGACPDPTAELRDPRSSSSMPAMQGSTGASASCLRAQLLPTVLAETTTRQSPREVLTSNLKINFGSTAPSNMEDGLFTKTSAGSRELTCGSLFTCTCVCVLYMDVCALHTCMYVICMCYVCMHMCVLYACVLVWACTACVHVCALCVCVRVHCYIHMCLCMWVLYIM